MNCVSFNHCKDLMQDEENAYSVEKLWGLGPLKEEAPVENPEEVVNFERYKVTEGCIMIFTAHYNVVCCFCNKYFLQDEVVGLKPNPHTWRIMGLT